MFALEREEEAEASRFELTDLSGGGGQAEEGRQKYMKKVIMFYVQTLCNNTIKCQ